MGLIADRDALLREANKLPDAEPIERLEKMVLFLQPEIEADEAFAEKFRRHAQSGEKPKVEIVPVRLPVHNLWDYGQVFDALVDYTAASLTFNQDTHRYFIYMTVGTHVAQSCMYLLLENGTWIGDIVQTIPPTSPNVHDRQIGDIRVVQPKKLLARALQKKSAPVTAGLREAMHTKNQKFAALLEEIDATAARSNANILLQGSTGTGKTELAKKIKDLRYEYGLLHDKTKFIEENCATISGALAGSTLFGHKKGAFTGADADRVGRLKEADGGVLFLDEIGDLGLPEQAMLLKAIEEKKFFPVGGTGAVASDFQLICATNKDLWAEVAEKRFRADLLARINVWTFRLPDFTERRDDLKLLFDAVLERRRKDMDEKALKTDDAARRFSLKTPAFTPGAKEKFLQFAESPEAAWSGNYRDLWSAVERMSVLGAAAKDGVVTEAVAEKEIKRLRGEWKRGRSKNAADDTVEEYLRIAEQHLAEKPSGRPLNGLERAELSYVINVCRKHRTLTAAAKEVYEPSRNDSNLSSKLRAFLNKYGLTFEDFHPVQ
jgi:transcriptional regulatory protein RtcR